MAMVFVVALFRAPCELLCRRGGHPFCGVAGDERSRPPGEWNLVPVGGGGGQVVDGISEDAVVVLVVVLVVQGV